MKNKLSSFILLWMTVFGGAAHADPYRLSFRIRPLALIQNVYGLETFLSSSQGYFAGLTAHFFSGNNDVKLTSLMNSELGVKFGKLFCDTDLQKGFFLMGSVDLQNTTVSSLYLPTSQLFTNRLSEFSESLFGGYQFRATFINERHWDFRLGLGIVYKPEAVATFKASDGLSFPVGVRRRLDPTLEFTVGYEL